MLFNPDESRINGALIEVQGVLRNLLKPVGDAIGMLRAHGGKGAEDHEVESALQDWDWHFFTWYSSEHKFYLGVKWSRRTRLEAGHAHHGNQECFQTVEKRTGLFNTGHPRRAKAEVHGQRTHLLVSVGGDRQNQMGTAALHSS